MFVSVYLCFEAVVVADCSTFKATAVIQCSRAFLSLPGRRDWIGLKFPKLSKAPQCRGLTALRESTHLLTCHASPKIIHHKTNKQTNRSEYIKKQKAVALFFLNIYLSFPHNNRAYISIQNPNTFGKPLSILLKDTQAGGRVLVMNSIFLLLYVGTC